MSKESRRNSRTIPQYVNTAGDVGIRNVAGEQVVEGTERPDEPQVRLRWQLQVTVGVGSEPRAGRFYGLAPDEVDTPSVRTSPHLAGLMRGLESEGHGPSDRWVRIGIPGSVDEADWAYLEQGFAVVVERDEAERVAMNERYRRLAERHRSGGTV